MVIYGKSKVEDCLSRFLLGTICGNFFFFFNLIEAEI